jgi:internalin A
MSNYKYDNPDDAYQEALSRIKQAKNEVATELDLSELGLTVVPPEIGQWIGLRKLYLSQNKLTVILPEIGRLVELNVLDLRENRLTTVPPEIGQLTELTTLYLHNNQLTAVPPEIEQLKKLTLLALDMNRVTVFPTEVFRLPGLTTLGLGENRLTVVPPEIGQLTELTVLYLDGNQLTAISPEITQLTKLKRLDLRVNPDLPIPPEIVEHWDNAQAILDYLRQREAELPRPLNEAKLILVGQGGVGKTSLVKRLMGQGFDEAENQTEGINIKNWSLKVNRPRQGVVPIVLNIWDFGGQEIMHATHQFFLTKRSLYLLVLDARQGEDEGRVEYWLTLINSFAPDAPVLIVINKWDQHHLEINRRGLQEKYPAIRGFIRTSARDERGIEELKTEIATILATMEHVDSSFPASWMQVKKTLTTMQTEHDYIPYTAYRKLCQTKNVTDESSQQTLIRFLHDLGIVLNFDDDRVHDTNVLNPNWITQGIYVLLNNPALQKQHGLLLYNQIQTLLPTTAFPTAEQRRFVREMMLKFELAFELPDRQRMLIPDLISKEQPGFEWDDAAALQFAYQYTVLPHSILHRFMVRQHQRIDEKIRWHTGVMLHQDSFTALVKADIKATTIRISIVGDGDRRQFLYALRLEFASIHESISGTKPQEVVPIPGHPTAPPIGYAYLEQLEKNNVDNIHYPDKNGEVLLLDVQELLNGVSTMAMRQAGLQSRKQILDSIRSLDQTEFRSLLFVLNINPGDLAGDTDTLRKMECLEYMERRGRLAELITEITRLRPERFEHARTLSPSLQPPAPPSTFSTQDEKRRRTVDKDAAVYTTSVFLGGTLLLGIVIVILFQLAMNEFGWDEMEPWTYLAGLLAAVLGYTYFAITQSEISPAAIYQKMLQARKQKLYHKYDL